MHISAGKEPGQCTLCLEIFHEPEDDRQHKRNVSADYHQIKKAVDCIAQTKNDENAKWN
jgi:hypothetical protein